MSQKNSPWPQKDEALRKLFAEGVSTSLIAQKLEVTKNSVLGRMHRLGLYRPSPIKRLPAGEKPARNRRGNPKPIPLQTAPSLAAPPVELPTTTTKPVIREMRATSFCAWPIGEPHGISRQFKFCEVRCT